VCVFYIVVLTVSIATLSCVSLFSCRHFTVTVTRSLSCPTTCCLALRLSHTFRCHILSCFRRHCHSPCYHQCLSMSTDALASFDVRHNCLVFIVTFTATDRAFLMLHWHPHRRVITTVLVLHCHVSPGFAQQLVQILSIFYPDTDILSRFLSLLPQSLTPSVSFVCLHYHFGRFKCYIDTRIGVLLPRFWFYTATFRRFCTAISAHFVYFLHRLRHTVTFSIIIAPVVSTISVICMSSLLLPLPSWT